MSINIADQYYLKALDAFYFDPATALESLQYALSYEDEHAPSLCLMGRLMMEKLKLYAEAAHFFELAIIVDPTYLESYKYYSLLLIWINQYEKAERILRKWARVPGMSKLLIFKRRAMMYELQGKLDSAYLEIRKATMFALCADSYRFFHNEKKRLKKKMKKSGLKNLKKGSTSRKN